MINKIKDKIKENEIDMTILGDKEIFSYDLRIIDRLKNNYDISMEDLIFLYLSNDIKSMLYCILMEICLVDSEYDAEGLHYLYMNDKSIQDVIDNNGKIILNTLLQVNEDADFFKEEKERVEDLINVKDYNTVMYNPVKMNVNGLSFEWFFSMNSLLKIRSIYSDIGEDELIQNLYLKDMDTVLNFFIAGINVDVSINTIKRFITYNDFIYIYNTICVNLPLFLAPNISEEKDNRLDIKESEKPKDTIDKYTIMATEHLGITLNDYYKMTPRIFYTLIRDKNEIIKSKNDALQGNTDKEDNNGKIDVFSNNEDLVPFDASKFKKGDD